VAIALVALALQVLPRPLDRAASVLAPLYFLGRAYPSLGRLSGLIALLAAVFLPFLPAWITGHPLDLSLAEATLFFIAPWLARAWTWRDRTGRWDFLDPLCIAAAPFAFTLIAIWIARLFWLGALSWT
jgi:hypothetical protein